jgi:hypothetical protein
VNDVRKGKLSASSLLVARYLFSIAVCATELAIVVALSIAVGTAVFGGLKAIFASAVKISGNPAIQPRLVFACCETPAKAGDFQSLFANPAVISDLKELHAGIAMALPDLSAGRAQAVSFLNEARIPVTAWLLLPAQQGYYMNDDNAAETEARFNDFQRWTAEYQLRWQAVGLDIEPDIREFTALKQESRWRLFLYLARRCFDDRQVSSARVAYAGLIRNIQSSGYQAQTYQLPFIVAERRASSTLLERLLGIVAVRGNVEVVMLYTSFNPSIGSAMIWKFGPESQAISVGVTGGKSGLDWTQFSRDLIVAGRFTNLVGVYSLEGCVQQGFLKRLVAMNWDHTVVIPSAAVRKAILLHALFPATLWTLSHFAYFVAFIILLNVWLAWRRRRKQREEKPNNKAQA